MFFISDGGFGDFGFLIAILIISFISHVVNKLKERFGNKESKPNATKNQSETEPDEVFRQTLEAMGIPLKDEYVETPKPKPEKKKKKKKTKKEKQEQVYSQRAYQKEQTQEIRPTIASSQIAIKPDLDDLTKSGEEIDSYSYPELTNLQTPRKQNTKNENKQIYDSPKAVSKFNREIREMLREPNSIKKAFVLKEILDEPMATQVL